MERKTVKFEVKEIDEEEGTFSGYASTFTNVPDSYGDVVDAGAFKKTIKDSGGRVKILWNHSVMEPIGKPTELSEDSIGLLVKGKLTLGVQRARETLALMKDGVINEMSIGYDAVQSKMIKGVRHLTETKLWDVSPVTFAANPSAMIFDVKAIENAINNNQLEPVQDAVKELQALLAKFDNTEPSTDTPVVNTDLEAADGVLNSIRSDIDGFDTKQANDRIDAAINKLTEVN